MWKLGSKSKRVYNSGIVREMQLIIDEACHVCPIEFTLDSGLRKTQEQFELFQIGRKHDPNLGSISNPDAWVLIPKGQPGFGKVTNCDGIKYKSNHQSGKAIDLHAYIKGRPDLAYDRIHMGVIIGSFLTIAAMMYERREIRYKLRSGADWDGDTEYLEPGTFIDLPHLELYEP